MSVWDLAASSGEAADHNHLSIPPLTSVSPCMLMKPTVAFREQNVGDVLTKSICVLSVLGRRRNMVDSVAEGLLPLET